MRYSDERFAKEEELAEAVVQWLEQEGWDVYQEVQPGRGAPVCDIVAVKMTDVWTISCKNSLALKVILQAHYWRARKYSNFSSIAVPAPKRPKRSYSNAWSNHYGTADLLKTLGVGMLVVSKNERFRYGREKEGETHMVTVNNFWQSKYQEMSRGGIMRYLRDEHKTYAKAGSAKGGHWTPFRGTVDKLVRYIEENPGCAMKEAVGAIQHHYANDKSAINSLLVYIRRGVIDKIQLVSSGNAYKLYTPEQWAKRQNIKR